MNKLSAKTKLTLWTTLLLLLMAGVLLGLMFSISDNIIAANSISRLKEAVHDNAGDLEFDDAQLDTDDIDLFNKGVYTLLFSQEGHLLAGSFPEDFAYELSLNNNQSTSFTLDTTLYYLYDTLSPVEDSSALVWVRGIIAVDDVAGATNNLLQMALFALPVFIALGALGSYIIAKNTFRPIAQITHTAETISKSEDLSLRINLQKGSGEIHHLAQTFDTMFERLEHAFETEKQFTSDVSHELRTPTAVILAQCEYALGDGVTPADKEDALDTVYRQARKMSTLIGDLLRYMRLERGIEKATFQPLDLSALVTEICEEYRLIAPCHIQLRHHITPHIHGRFDEAMIIRLLGNLISNAFRYTGDDAHVDITLSTEENAIILAVKDDGIGIAKEHQEKIWQRFYQVDASRTASQNGSMGLGLSMVAQIARLHNATIDVDSDVGQGSKFMVKFPR